MKYLKLVALSVLFVLLLFLISCTKSDRKEVKETIDTASQKLGRDVDTLVDAMLNNDSLYKNAPLEKVDVSKLPRETFRDKLNDIFDNYSDIKDELADDDSMNVIKQADDFSKTLMRTQTESASEQLGSKWRLWIASVEKTIGDIKATTSIDKQRLIFSELSASMETFIKNFGLSGMTVYKVSCSTMKQKNNFWFTDSKDNINPYYGKDKSNEKSPPCIEVANAWEFE